MLVGTWTSGWGDDDKGMRFMVALHYNNMGFDYVSLLGGVYGNVKYNYIHIRPKIYNETIHYISAIMNYNCTKI